MKKAITTLFFLLLSALTFGQKQEVMEQIEAAKIGIITQRLNLTAEQSKSFWIIYNQYSTEKKALRENMRSLFAESNTASDDQMAKNVEKMLEIKGKEAELDKKYYKEFQKIISVRQIFELYKAELQFKNMLIDKLARRNEKKYNKKNGSIEEMIDD